MALAISMGQFTITDLSDAQSLTAVIAASQASSQTYNNTTKAYSPSYTSSPQVLTLHLMKAGTTTSLIGGNITNIKWTKTVGATTTEIVSTTTTDVEYKSGTKHSVLTTKANIPTENNAVTYTATGTWTDPSNSQLVSDFSASITLTLVQLAKAAIIPNIYAPDGDMFRNNMPASLKINADLYKDGVLSTGSKKFKWFVADSSIETAQDTDAGSGWRKVTATTGATGAVASSGFDVAVTTQGVLTVYPDAVVNAQTFMVVITDNAGGTAGTKVKQYLTLRDMDDNVSTIIESSGGSVFKNGAGSTVLNARVYRAGVEIDENGTQYTYKWSKWQNNALVSNFGGTSNPYKTGKTLSVGSADVQLQTTFKVEVEPK